VNKFSDIPFRHPLTNEIQTTVNATLTKKNATPNIHRANVSWPDILKNHNCFIFSTSQQYLPEMFARCIQLSALLLTKAYTTITAG